MSARLRGALPLAAAALLLLVPYRNLLAGRVPAARDLLFYFYPVKAALAESLRAGLVPWIDRYRWGGLPLLGAPGAAPFDPGNLLFAALPLGAAGSAWILFRLLTGLSASTFSGDVSGFRRGRGGGSLALFLLGADDLRRSISGRLGGPLVPSVGRRSHAGGTTLSFTGLGGAIRRRRRADPRLQRPGVRPLRPPRRGYSRRGASRGRLEGIRGASFPHRPCSRRGCSARGGPRGSGTSRRPRDDLHQLADGRGGIRSHGRRKRGPSPGATRRASFRWRSRRLEPGPVRAGPRDVLPIRSFDHARARRAWPDARRPHSRRCRAPSGCDSRRDQHPSRARPATPVWGGFARLLPVVGSLRYPERHVLLSGLAFAWLAALGIRALEGRVRRPPGEPGVRTAPRPRPRGPGRDRAAFGRGGAGGDPHTPSRLLRRFRRFRTTLRRRASCRATTSFPSRSSGAGISPR